MIAGLSQVTVAVTNTDLTSLHWLWMLYGGTVRRCVEPTADGVRQTYQWYAGGENAVRFLKRVSTYLRVKGPQAGCALQFRLQEIDPASASKFMHNCKRKEDHA